MPCGVYGNCSGVKPEEEGKTEGRKGKEDRREDRIEEGRQNKREQMEIGNQKSKRQTSRKKLKRVVVYGELFELYKV